MLFPMLRQSVARAEGEGVEAFRMSRTSFLLLMFLYDCPGRVSYYMFFYDCPA